ncbi:MAG: class I SAM-dependent methyltransferase [Bacteroidales bacterium]|nr:class I SAM-dependent methyltransferase [Bacteroidales bacterium]
MNENILHKPILDIACGKEAYLVQALSEKGYDVYGFDRLISAVPNVACADWHSYEYGRGKWGTIISNVSFSNHFIHHHYRSNGEFVDFTKTYMKILESLKPGGFFYYSRITVY